jgi:hypothetical protein
MPAKDVSSGYAKIIAVKRATPGLSPGAFLLQFLALAIYVVFVGFCFCDGFKLHITRKVLWYIVFLAVALYVLANTDQFNLALILPVPTLIAIMMCAFQEKESAEE